MVARWRQAANGADRRRFARTGNRVRHGLSRSAELDQGGADPARRAGDQNLFAGDHPGLLQTFIWQCLDLPPKFPVVRRFLDFWELKLDGRLHSVRIGNAGPMIDGQWRHLGSEDLLH